MFVAGAGLVWLVGAQAAVPLSAADAERLAELAGERRERFLRGRAALAAALREAYGRDDEPRPARCPDCGRRHGPPEFDGGGPFATVSHAGSGSLAAVADVAVGVDVEARAARSPDALALPLPAGELDAFQHWTRIEAVLKADGRGLRIDPAAIGFRRASGGVRFATVPGGGVFEVHDVAVPGGYAASLAVAAASRGVSGAEGTLVAEEST